MVHVGCGDLGARKLARRQPDAGLVIFEGEVVY